MVDANAAYTLDDAPSTWRALDRFGLMMIEQPLEYEDVHDHARLQRRIATPICLDESIHTRARRARCHRRRRVPHHQRQAGPRRAGIRESIRLHDLCAAHGIPVWHGGMLESGIGRAHNIHLSASAQLHAAGRRRGQQAVLRPRPDRPAH